MQDEEPKVGGPPGATPATAITDDSAAPETKTTAAQTPEEAAKVYKDAAQKTYCK